MVQTVVSLGSANGSTPSTRSQLANFAPDRVKAQLLRQMAGRGDALRSNGIGAAGQRQRQRSIKEALTLVR
jgi:hypothetical protein